MDDTQAMERCLELARAAVDHGDEPYGSVIVRDGVLLAEGRNSQVTDLDPTAHAEVSAIRNACRKVGSYDLSGCTLYSSFEPCWICSTAIRRTGIARVVFAADDGDGGYFSAYPILRDATIPGPPPPEVVTGFMADRSEALLRETGFRSE
jgi:tRNA(Arg) A34 adenosine deaminase TadA